MPSLAAMALAGTVACAEPALAPSEGSPYVNPYIEELTEAVGSLRLFEPRLSGERPWAACWPSPAGPDDLIPSARCATLEVEDPARRRVESLWSEILEQEALGESPELLHAKGIVSLFLSRGEDEPALGTGIDQAIRYLEQALLPASEWAAQRAAILNDLSVAYAVRAGEADDPADLMRALDRVKQALGEPGNADNPAFLSNRALFRQRLFLREMAAEDWEMVADLTVGTGWSSEATSRGETLRQPTPRETWRARKEALLGGEVSAGEVQEVVAHFSQQVREWAEEELLGRWAAHQASGEVVEADRVLGLLEQIGRAQVDSGGDGLLLEALEAIRDARDDAFGTRRLESLVAGHRRYTTGLERAREYDTENAERVLEEARRSLADGGSPFASWADFQLAIILYRQQRLYESLDLLDDIEGALKPSHVGLQGRVDWLRALAVGSAGFMDAAQEALDRSMDAFARIGEIGSVASVRVLQANLLMLLHQPEAGAQQVYQALGLWEIHEKRRRRHTILKQAADSSETAGAPRAARDFYRILVEQEVEEPNSTDSAHAYLGRSQLLARLELQEEARTDLDRARWYADLMPPGSTQHRVEADIAVAEAELQANPAAAVSQLGEAIEFYGQGDRQFELPRLYRARARFAVAAGNVALAESDLYLGLEVVDRFLSSLSDVGQLSRVEQEQKRLAEDLLGILARDEQRAAEAFAVADRVQGRVSQELVQRNGRSAGAVAGARGWTVAEIQARLPEDVALIEYAVLEDRLLVWVLRASAPLFFESISVGRSDLEARVAALSVSLQEHRSDAEAHAAARALAEVLLEPLADALEGARRLVLVPDGDLHGVAYREVLAALPNGELQQVVESLTRSPSAGLYLHAEERAGVLRTSSREAGSTLVLGAPKRLDERLFPPLRRADEEAERVASLLGTQAWLGAQATKDRFVQEIAHARVVHFAGHAWNDPAYPGRSFLALASETERSEDGNLYASEIAELDLRHTELVVLSACSTAGTGRGGGLPLAQAFLAAGVPTVVATLWPVEDGWLSKLAATHDLRKIVELAAQPSPIHSLVGATVYGTVSTTSSVKEPVN